MDFVTAAKYGSLLAREYAEDIFDLLVNYQAVSASEVANRLDLHIQTAQDFLDNLVALGIAGKEEVFEKKRPYYRYSLVQTRIIIDLDLLQVKRQPAHGSLTAPIRERENGGARFSASRSGDAIASVTIWTGEGREKQERRIKLTLPQGRFLYYLPFPKAESMTLDAIMRKAGVGEDCASEILDLVELLLKNGVIEQV